MEEGEVSADGFSRGNYAVEEFPRTPIQNFLLYVLL